MITIDRETLLESLSFVKPVVATRTTKPILSMVKLSVSDGKLRVVGTDLEMSAATEKDCETSGECSVLVYPQKISELVQASGAETVTLRQAGENIELRIGATRLEFTSPDVNEFPEMESGIDDPIVFTVRGSELAEALACVGPMTSKNEATRWATTGVLLHLKGGQLALVATDTRQIGMVRMAVDSEWTIQSIIPMKAVAMVQKFAGEVTIELGKSLARFTCDGSTICTRLVEGKFPPYQDIVPKKTNNRYEIEAELLASAMRQALVIADAEDCRVMMDFESDGLTVRMSNRNFGEMEAPVQVKSASGPNTTVHIDPKYVWNSVKGMKGVLRFQFKDANSPMLIEQGEDRQIVIVPMVN